MTPINGVRGWLLLLVLVLLAYQPLDLAAALSTAIDALPIRGLPLALGLVARVLVAAVGVAAGISLLNRRPAAVALARVALVLGAGMDLVEYSTRIFPSNRVPGTTPLLATASIVFYGGWLLYLSRSKRVKETFR
jgi:hypothetical protein